MGVKGLRPSAETRARISASLRGRKLSLAHRAKLTGNQHAWKGGRTIGSTGYVLIFSPTHPHKDCGGYVYEHRLVMEAHLGRTLLPTEVCHHINGIKDDNRIENLTRFDSQSDHASWHYQNEKEEES